MHIYLFARATGFRYRATSDARMDVTTLGSFGSQASQDSRLGHCWKLTAGLGTYELLLLLLLLRAVE